MSKDTAAVKVYEVDCLVEPNGEVKRNVFLVVKNGKLLEKTFRCPDVGQIKKIKGTLYPPFVNAHTHLELSSMSFSPDKFSDFFEWLLWMISKRQTFTESWIQSSLKKGFNLLKNTGTYYVGDISSFGFSRKIPSPELEIIPFLEVIGKDKDIDSLEPPISAHSIYSVSFDLLKKIATDSLERNYPFQIHLGEVKDEQLLVAGKPNRFEMLVYPILGRKKYPMPQSKNLIDYLERAGALHENTIAVHCTNLSEKEMEVLVKRGVSIVVCPRSNLHLKVGFPKIQEFIGYEKLALGTDGISTNTSINVLEEFKVLYYLFECRISLKRLFPMLTFGGANALKLSCYSHKALFAYTSTVSEDPLGFLLTIPSLKIITL